MAERPWRIDVASVTRGDASGPGPVPELVPLVRRRRWDRAAVVVVAGSIAVALLKPGAGAPVDEAVSPATPAAQAPAAATPAATVPVALSGIARPAEATLPLAAFAPPASHCMEDMGWRVCVVGDDRQTTLNDYAPDGPPLTDRVGSAQRAEPVVVLSTNSGAAVAFYPPAGFYTPVEGPANDTSGTDPEIVFGPAWGPVAISAWSVDDRGSHSLALDRIGAFSSGGLVASNVLVVKDEGFLHAPVWPPGRYVIWLEGSGVQVWQEFFDLQVVSSPPIAP